MRLPKISFKYFSVAFCISILICCDQDPEKNIMNDHKIDSSQTFALPNIESTKPIHAVGGTLEEDPTDLNHDISAHGGSLTPEQIIKMYYPHEVDPKAEGNETIIISKEELEEGIIKVTLIDDNMLDDSQKASKIELTLEPVGTAWKVIKIEKQWKCYEGRGHTDWGIQSCS